MKIKHKLTGQTTEINFDEWASDYLTRRLNSSYDILQQDTVFLRKINSDGTRTLLGEKERTDALQVVKNQPNDYDFIEQHVKFGKTSFSTRAYLDSSYEDFKLAFGQHLRGSLDSAFFHVTGKLPNTKEPQTMEKLIEKLVSDNEKLSLLLLEARTFFLEDSNVLQLIDSELKGYRESPNDQIPSYRQLNSEILVDFVDPFGNIQKLIPLDVTEINQNLKLDLSDVLILDGISFIEDILLHLTSQEAHRKMPPQQVKLLAQLVEHNNHDKKVVDAVNCIQTASLKNIIASVRNEITKALQAKQSKKNIEVVIEKNTDSKTTERTPISVFVTYAWEEDSNQLVISFVNFLREKGYNASMDRSITQVQSSTDFNEMMVRNILDSDKVIVVLSETYKRKADNFEGGVGTEFRIILSMLQNETNKFIFVSFKSLQEVKANLILPTGLGNREIIDLKSDQDKDFQNIHAKLQSVNQLEFSDVGTATPNVVTEPIPPFKL